MKFHPDIRVFGDVSYRNKKCHSESIEQITFFNYIRVREPLAFHCKNDGKKSYGQAARQKAQGLTKGVPDIIIPAKVPFLCELKRQDHTCSKWQDGQQEYLLLAQEKGCFVCVALGHQAAINAYNYWSDHISK
jgi:hypothetical protein